MKKTAIQQNILADASAKSIDVGAITCLKKEDLPRMLLQNFSSNLAAALFVCGKDRHDFYEYLLSELTQIKLERIQSGYLNKEEYSRCAEVLKYLSKSPLYIDDAVSLDISEIKKRVDRLSRELTLQGIKLGLIVFWTAHEGEVDSNKKRKWQVKLQEISLKFCVPVIMVKE